MSGDYTVATGNVRVVTSQPHHRLTGLGLEKHRMMLIHGIYVDPDTKIKVVQAVEQGSGECDCGATGGTHKYGCHSRCVVVQFPNDEVMVLDFEDVRNETADEKNVLRRLAFQEKLIAFENGPEPENWGD